jgi:two-component system, chemotaxis family, CheB/CheR fusion protein
MEFCTLRPGRTAAATCRSTAFLRALAGDRGSKAFGVILSGTASDGTLGLQAIKAAGGITFAQEMRTAKFDGMPGSAIARRRGRFCPAAGRNRGATGGHRARLLKSRSDPLDAIQLPADAELAKILRLVRSATGVDFTHYKHSTLARRIKRRMVLRGFENAGRLQPRSRAEPRGSKRAVRELFDHRHCILPRAPVFEELKKKVFPALVENRGSGDSIRIWVPGCATGEEAYSIAICLMEFLARHERELFRSRSSPPILVKRRSKSPLRHIRRRRVGPCFATANGAVLHPNGTRVPGCEDRP